MKMLETIHILPVRAESAAPAPLRGKKLDQRAVPQGRLEKGRSHRRRRDCRVRRGQHSEPVQILSGHRRARAQKAARPAE